MDEEQDEDGAGHELGEMLHEQCKARMFLTRIMQAFDALLSPGAIGAHRCAVRTERMPSGRPGDWMPCPDHLVMSRFSLPEWTGLLAQRMGF